MQAEIVGVSTFLECVDKKKLPEMVAFDLH